MIDCPRLVGGARELRKLPATGFRGFAATSYVLGLYVVVETLLRLQPTARVVERFGLRMSVGVPCQEPGPPLGRHSLSRTEEVRWAVVKRLTPLLYGDDRGCLRRAMVLGVILRRHNPVLRLGVRRGEESFTAHAWLEIDGRQIEAAHGYEPLESTR